MAQSKRIDRFFIVGGQRDGPAGDATTLVGTPEQTLAGRDELTPEEGTALLG